MHYFPRFFLYTHSLHFSFLTHFHFTSFHIFISFLYSSLNFIISLSPVFSAKMETALLLRPLLYRCCRLSLSFGSILVCNSTFIFQLLSGYWRHAPSPIKMVLLHIHHLHLKTVMLFSLLTLTKLIHFLLYFSFTLLTPTSHLSSFQFPSSRVGVPHPLLGENLKNKP